MAIKFEITKDCQQDISDLGLDVFRCLNLNYLIPIKNGSAVNQLQGKFKPSWDASLNHVFLKFAKKHSLYHYHFGFQFYTSGKDKKYPGDVSSGIVHIVVIDDSSSGDSVHKLVKICTSHTPFRIPVDRL